MLDFDLAVLYMVETRRLKEAVRRNKLRFPADFMFELTKQEYLSLRSQFAALEKKGRGAYAKYLPFAFTELWKGLHNLLVYINRAGYFYVEWGTSF